MAEGMAEQERRTKRLAHIRRALEESFPEVEHVGTTRFLVWGSSAFRHRPYLEIWLDRDFLAQEDDAFQASSQRIVSEAEGMLRNPERAVRKQGEILASGGNRITVRRGLRIYSL